MKQGLLIENLVVEVAGNRVVDGLNLYVPKGEVHAIMGPNGTGKSSLSKALAGNKDYKILSGKAELDGVDIVGKAPEEISKEGLFLAFQYPVEIPGVSIANFIRACLKARLPEGEDLHAPTFYKELYARMQELGMDKSFSSRGLNVGFSGGEKKRCDILQMLMLKPKIAILDETDSGLDIDAVRVVSDGVNAARSRDLGILLITHYQRLLDHITPDKVHVMFGGKIVKTGGAELALELEKSGYENFKK
ncbi:MAG: Fe-S cluster assembly ATPase SufC [Opitutales bacterium]|nr:Fe-S cluster assembly ATPase SufC [Opitutales bacterium]